MVCKKWIRQNHRKGVSLIELVVAVAAAMVLILGIGIMLAHSQQGFTNMYKRAHSNVVEDAYSARRTFDKVVRKSTSRRCDLISNSEIYVYYYYLDDQDIELYDPDRFARFYVVSGVLFVDYGNIDWASGTLDPAYASVRLARDVQISADSPLFSVRARTVYMSMLLDNGKESMMVTSSAVRHNK